MVFIPKFLVIEPDGFPYTEDDKPRVFRSKSQAIKCAERVAKEHPGKDIIVVTAIASAHCPVGEPFVEYNPEVELVPPAEKV